MEILNAKSVVFNISGKAWNFYRLLHIQSTSFGYGHCHSGLLLSAKKQRNADGGDDQTQENKRYAFNHISEEFLVPDPLEDFEPGAEDADQRADGEKPSRHPNCADDISSQDQVRVLPQKCSSVDEYEHNIKSDHHNNVACIGEEYDGRFCCLCHLSRGFLRKAFQVREGDKYGIDGHHEIMRNAFKLDFCKTICDAVAQKDHQNCNEDPCTR